MKNKEVLKNRNIVLIIIILANLFYFGVKLEYTIASFLYHENLVRNYLFLLPEIILVIVSLIYLLKITSDFKGPQISFKNILINNILIVGSITVLFFIIWYYSFVNFYNTGFGFQQVYFENISLYFASLVLLNLADIIFKIVFLHKKKDKPIIITNNKEYNE